VSALAVPAHPRWAVHSVSIDSDFYINHPNCGSLEYFSRDPQRFDYGGDLLGKNPGKLKEVVDSWDIGEAAGFTVHQLTHTIDNGALVMKMILVERGPGEFCEIYHQQYGDSEVVAGPAYLVTVNSETILATTDMDRGNGAWREEEYWAFDKEGPIPLDATPKIDAITRKLLPRGRTIMNGSGFDIRTLSYDMPVWRDGDSHCCPTGGKIHIKFALTDHNLIAVNESFDPH
jgi:hypothetical protein